MDGKSDGRLSCTPKVVRWGVHREGQQSQCAHTDSFWVVARVFSERITAQANGLWVVGSKPQTLFFFFLTTELSQRDKSLDHHFIPDGRWLKVTTVIFSSHLSGLL